MTPSQLAALRQLAEQATPGSWAGRVGHGGCDYIVKAERLADARFIAALNPTTATALLDRIEELQRENERLRSTWDAGVAELTAAAEAQVEQWKRHHDHEAKRGDHYKKQRDGAMEAMFEKSDAADAYRAMLCDLVAAYRGGISLSLFERARELLKNGPAAKGANDE